MAAFWRNCPRWRRGSRSRSSSPPRPGPGSRWFGASGIHAASYIDQLYTDFRDQVLRPPPGTRILGFAETRHLMSDQQFTAYCDNLRERFPRALLIFNTRDNEHVIAANRGAAPVADDAVFARADDQFRSYAAAHPESCIEIRYDDYMVSNQALRPLFDRLGLPFDDEVIDRILARDRATLPEKHHKPGVIENEVLIGKDGWLFLWDGSNEVHRYYTDPDYFTDEDARNWADLLTTRRDRIEVLGARYLHMTVPDKLSLLPEFVTLRLPHFDRRPTRLVASLLPGDGVNLDILPDCARPRNKFPVFHRTDSHWTTAGCQAAYRRLCACSGRRAAGFLGSRNQCPASSAGSRRKTDTADHGNAGLYRDLEKIRRVAENEAVRYNEQTGFPEGKPHFVGCYVHMQNDSPDARPETVLLFGDLFSESPPEHADGDAGRDLSRSAFRLVHPPGFRPDRASPAADRHLANCRAFHGHPAGRYVRGFAGLGPSARRLWKSGLRLRLRRAIQRLMHKRAFIGWIMSARPVRPRVDLADGTVSTPCFKVRQAPGCRRPFRHLRAR